MRVEDVNTVDPKPVVGVYSFGSKVSTGRPQAQYEFDITTMRDPSGQKQFVKESDGRSELVRKWIGEDDRVPGIISFCRMLADDLVKPKTRTTENATRVEPVSQWLSIAFYDFHGKWAAPAIAEIVADALSDDGYTVAVKHYALKQG